MIFTPRSCPSNRTGISILGSSFLDGEIGRIFTVDWPSILPDLNMITRVVWSTLGGISGVVPLKNQRSKILIKLTQPPGGPSFIATFTKAAT
jgi:hypothetical protein